MDPHRRPVPVPADALGGGVLLLETSEELIPARSVGHIVRALGERGCSASSTRFWSYVRRSPTSPAVLTGRNVSDCERSSGTWWSTSSLSMASDSGSSLTILGWPTDR